MWHKIMQDLGLVHLHLTLGGLRAGGATALFEQTRNLPVVQYLGEVDKPSQPRPLHPDRYCYPCDESSTFRECGDWEHTVADI